MSGGRVTVGVGGGAAVGMGAGAGVGRASEPQPASKAAIKAAISKKAGRNSNRQKPIPVTIGIVD